MDMKQKAIAYAPAVSEEEKKIEEDIQFILSAKPQIAADYFKFPLEWKLNGLADLVLEVFNVKHIFVESK